MGEHPRFQVTFLTKDNSEIGESAWTNAPGRVTMPRNTVFVEMKRMTDEAIHRYIVGTRAQIIEMLDELIEAETGKERYQNAGILDSRKQLIEDADPNLKYALNITLAEIEEPLKVVGVIKRNQTDAKIEGSHGVEPKVNVILSSPQRLFQKLRNLLSKAPFS